jgi:Ni/Co efflux regulator RcnB
MKSVIKALLAASMLMPIAAQAQEQDGRERGQGRRGGEWGQRAPRADRQAQVGVEGQARVGRSADAPVDAQVRAERPQRGEFRAERPQQVPPQQQQDARSGQRDGGQDWRQGDRQQRDRSQQAPRERGQQDGQRWDRGDRQQAGNGWRQPDRRDQTGQGFRADPRGYDRQQGYRQPGYAQNNGYRGNDRGNWNGNRRVDNGRDGAWNRGWRNDNRYDWNRNRQVNRSAYRLPRYYAPSGWGYGYRRFSVGVSLSSILFSQNYWIDDAYNYRLPEAYGPYRWVRYYDDALLVDIRSGQVVDTVYDIFD